MKEILITNDDGFEADGLKELARALKSIARVTVVAPSSEKSACAHSLTLTKPLRFIKLDDGFFKLDDATPADCVFLALHSLYSKKPDLIISGINHGANVAEDITYSGTCGGAMEGVLHGIPSLSISQFYLNDSLDKFGFDLACEISLKVVKNIFENGYPLPEKKFLNLNIPAVGKADYKGLKVVAAGEKTYLTSAQVNRNPRGLEYFWLGQMNIDFDKDKNTNSDIGALVDGYASLTPITLNLTSHNELESVQKWIR
ncbi:5'/3'-nucleotidase SurE [Campylobacter geochelonis]|uniref:5'/3'-nucleotidase SurE n=1 Tax=Campylobacter geochelonis TaxID=1780362 RepID=UPI000770B13B|nr:5'/3'-nucleotidase SurE [Campylobacter geochelonis]CZE46707.1 stationary phase survival protein SurE [Campylobacter geochelonis]CZE50343.1 stationary phase survival protein SurE [Campylobacter geochelonis]